MLYQKNIKENILEEPSQNETTSPKRSFALKREKITSVVSGIISESENTDVDQHMLDDYERLKAKCDEIISKIKTRRVKKVRRKDSIKD